MPAGGNSRSHQFCESEIEAGLFAGRTECLEDEEKIAKTLLGKGVPRKAVIWSIEDFETN